MFKEGVWNHTYKGRRAEISWNSRVKDDDGNVIFVKRKDFPKYMTEDFFKAYKIFCYSENLKAFPFAGGWAEQPAQITEIINLFKVEEDIWQQKQFEKQKEK